MEALPPELKLNILGRVDYQTLKAVVHASPAYHAVYRSARLEIFTSATLKHLDEVGFNIDPPSTWLKTGKGSGSPDHRRIEVCFIKPGPSLGLLIAAFDSYFIHFEESEGDHSPRRLPVEYCTALLSLKDVVATEVEAGEVRFTREVKFSHDHFAMCPPRLLPDHRGCKLAHREFLLCLRKGGE